MITARISLARQYVIKNVPDAMPPLHSKVDVLTSEDVEVNGVITQRSKYVCDDSEHRYDGMSAADFEPQNLSAVGVEPKPVKFTLNSFDACAYAELQVQALSAQFERINTKPQKPTE